MSNNANDLPEGRKFGLSSVWQGSSFQSSSAGNDIDEDNINQTPNVLQPPYTPNQGVLSSQSNNMLSSHFNFAEGVGKHFPHQQSHAPLTTLSMEEFIERNNNHSGQIGLGRPLLDSDAYVDRVMTPRSSVRFSDQIEEFDSSIHQSNEPNAGNSKRRGREPRVSGIKPPSALKQQPALPSGLRNGAHVQLPLNAANLHNNYHSNRENAPKDQCPDLAAQSAQKTASDSPDSPQNLHTHKATAPEAEEETPVEPADEPANGRPASDNPESVPQFRNSPPRGRPGLRGNKFASRIRSPSPIKRRRLSNSGVNDRSNKKAPSNTPYPGSKGDTSAPSAAAPQASQVPPSSPDMPNFLNNDLSFSDFISKVPFFGDSVANFRSDESRNPHFTAYNRTQSALRDPTLVIDVEQDLIEFLKTHSPVNLRLEENNIPTHECLCELVEFFYKKISPLPPNYTRQTDMIVKLLIDLGFPRREYAEHFLKLDRTIPRSKPIIMGVLYWLKQTTGCFEHIISSKSKGTPADQLLEEAEQTMLKTSLAMCLNQDNEYITMRTQFASFLTLKLRDSQSEIEQLERTESAADKAQEELNEALNEARKIEAEIKDLEAQELQLNSGQDKLRADLKRNKKRLSEIDEQNSKLEDLDIPEAEKSLETYVEFWRDPAHQHLDEIKQMISEYHEDERNLTLLDNEIAELEEDNKTDFHEVTSQYHTLKLLIDEYNLDTDSHQIPVNMFARGLESLLDAPPDDLDLAGLFSQFDFGSTNDYWKQLETQLSSENSSKQTSHSQLTAEVSKLSDTLDGLLASKSSLSKQLEALKSSNEEHQSKNQTLQTTFDQRVGTSSSLYQGNKDLADQVKQKQQELASKREELTRREAYLIEVDREYRKVMRSAQELKKLKKELVDAFKQATADAIEANGRADIIEDAFSAANLIRNAIKESETEEERLEKLMKAFEESNSEEASFERSKLAIEDSDS